LLWLVLAGLLVLHLDSQGAFGNGEPAPIAQANHLPPPAPLAPSEEPSRDLDADPAAATDILDTPAAADELPADAASGDVPGAVAEAPLAAPPAPQPESRPKPAAQPLPFPSEPASPLAHPSLRNAYDEPVMHELAALFDAIHVGLERPGATIDASLSEYVNQLVTRMNAEGQPYVVRLNHPNLEVVRRRAVRGHALLVEAGLRPWLLEVFGERGGAGVSVERG
jgi:hypothetical protein